MENRRVAITGIGAISCLGNSVKETWDALLAGKCGIDTITRFDMSAYRTRIAGEIKNFDITKYMSEKEARRLDDFCHYAIAATNEALLDAGFPGAAHLLMASIIRLGFDPADVRWIILTHAHFDHFGAANEFRNLYGTKVALSAVDTASMQDFPLRTAGSFSAIPHNLPVIDRTLKDGEIFSFGGKQIRCVLTPGHTLGTMSFFFPVTDQGSTYLAGLFGGAGTNALTLPYMLHDQLPLDMAHRMIASLDRIKDEPVAVHLGNHPGNNRTLQKRELQLKEGGNPFVDASSWPEFVASLRQNSLKIIAENAELARLHQIEL